MKSVMMSVVLVGVTLGAEAQAQEQDWEILRTDGVVAAATRYDNGITLMVRCTGESSLNALIAGLPAATGHTRQLATWFEGSEHDADAAPAVRAPRGWGTGANPVVAFSRYPAGLARSLRKGGSMNVMIPGAAQDGRNLRYVLDLPASPAAIETVLNTCGRELVDARDAEIEALGDSGLPHEIVWARQPRIEYPRGRTFVRGFVTVSCVATPDGRTEDCIVESEQPEGGGFAEAVLKAARGGRLRNRLAPNAALPPALIMFQANFIMEDEGAAAGGRLRGR